LKILYALKDIFNMKPITVVTSYSQEPFLQKTLLSLTESSLVEHVSIVSQEPVHLKIPKCYFLTSRPLTSYETLSLILNEVQTKYLLLIPEAQQILIEPKKMERILEVAESEKAGLIYSDFYDESKHGKTLHPLNDYRAGSVRDDFDFGAMMLFSVSAIRKALKKYGYIPNVQFAGLYDLRLKLSIDHSIDHLPEPLYSMTGTAKPWASEKIFEYVNPLNRTLQEEMETVFTDYLKKIGAYRPPHDLREAEQTMKSFPMEASVVIPVKNRKTTITKAVKSAISQKTDFLFDIIVVDNHSTDGTTAILSELSRKYPILKHIVPKRTDLGIGGCWNEALQHHACGRYAVQLDSDDLYSSGQTLQKMVDRLRQGRYAMVIGSYTLVNSRLIQIPPGLIDHREWTDENGHNNALRINGLGAPRAFDTSLMRKIRFRNASYGEDYAAALRICREYRIGRIYENLYLCRRWSGNTDSALSIEESNRNNAFKDRIRTAEILARQKMNQRLNPSQPPFSKGRRLRLPL
jgi:glycosyltransferase involved in cell wall biosynthesis